MRACSAGGWPVAAAAAGTTTRKPCHERIYVECKLDDCVLALFSCLMWLLHLVLFGAGLWISAKLHNTVQYSNVCNDYASVYIFIYSLFRPNGSKSSAFIV